MMPCCVKYDVFIPPFRLVSLDKYPSLLNFAYIYIYNLSRHKDYHNFILHFNEYDVVISQIIHMC